MTGSEAERPLVIVQQPQNGVTPSKTADQTLLTISSSTQSASQQAQRSQSQKTLTTMPSVESLLTRELDLRFIDARSIAAEARVTLGIEGYPSKDQVYEVRNEAIRIFQAKAQDEQEAMRRLNWDLEAVKIPAGSASLSDYVDSGASSDQSSVVSDASSSQGRKGGLRGILFRR